LLTESCVLAVAGGAAGLLVAHWTLAAVRVLVPDSAETIPFELNGVVLLFALALSIATGLLFGLFPALHSTRPDLASTLKNQSGQPAGARSAKWFRLTLATGQITLSMALLAMAGLFTKSLINVSRVDLGLKVDHLVTFSLAPRLSGYSPERTRLLFEQIEEAMAAVPGVTGATAALVPLLAGDNYSNSLSVQGFQGGPDVNSNASLNEVGPGYFRALGIPLLAGREFTRADVVGSPKVAIVNQAFMKKFHLGRDAAVGTLMAEGGGNGAKLDMEIVGVVPDTAYSDVKAAVPPQYFVPYRQDTSIGFANFYVQTALDPADIFRTIPGVVARFDPNLPVGELKTMPQQIRENVSGDRLVSTLSATFAAVATLLAAIGLYGVLAYTVSQRTREFGLRMALGADRRRVRGLVLGQVAWMTAIGGTIGLGIAVVLGTLAKSLLFRLEGYDPLVLTLSAVVLSLVAFAAGLVPALRASRLDPMRALRYE
jgi:predicted permease